MQDSTGGSEIDRGSAAVTSLGTVIKSHNMKMALEVAV